MKSRDAYASKKQRMEISSGKMQMSGKENLNKIKKKKIQKDIKITYAKEGPNRIAMYLHIED